MATRLFGRLRVAADFRAAAAMGVPEIVKAIKRTLLRLLGKSGEPVVVSFLSGPESLAVAMLEEVRKLVPDREHFAVTDLSIAGVQCVRPRDLPGPLRGRRIGLAPTLFTGDPEYSALRRKALLNAPFKLLAYNRALERHHLRLTTPIASWLFLKGVPLDRIFLRPKWLFPFRGERSTWPQTHQVIAGRPYSHQRRRVAILSPYLPYPLSHGGAVRIYNLLRECSSDFDIVLFAFAEHAIQVEGTPLPDLCAKIIVFPNPRYREPRWASLLPAEVHEFTSPYAREVVDQVCREESISVLQVEYTQLASYSGSILVEHDITFDLYRQIWSPERTLSAFWNYWRWHRYEKRAAGRFQRVLVMSPKDRELLGTGNVDVLPNGVDLKRFRAAPEQPGENLLFIGSFRHFPNVEAYRFFIKDIWPLLGRGRLTVIAGADPHRYLQEQPAPGVELHGFTSDVRPFYAAANIVIVPTTVSAGTNLKVLEAFACGRAVVSTSSGCAGLDVSHGVNIWIADSPSEFAEAVRMLLDDPALRATIAANGRKLAEQHYGWKWLGEVQRRVWNQLLTGITVRPATKSDLSSIGAIQSASHSASHWAPESYFEFDVCAAEVAGRVAGFLVSRTILGEIEILNLAVDPEFRRRGVGSSLIRSLPRLPIFLEVRESNLTAQNLYQKLGFITVGRREKYYDDPVETALVMRLSPLDESDTF